MTGLRSPGATRGFSLLEIAVVLVILGILLSAAIVPLASLDGQRREAHSAAELASVRDALIAHLVSQGALPCPVATGRARAGEASQGRCPQWRGGVPAALLALAGATDEAGALLDPWGRPYRLVISDADAEQDGAPGAPDWTTPGEPAAVGIAALRGTLAVCEQAVSSCPRDALRANDLVFVVVSLGADAEAGGLQRQNQAATGSFTLAQRSSVPGLRFDDSLVWASRSELAWWLLRAGRLP